MPKVERLLKFKDTPDGGAVARSTTRGAEYDSGKFVRVDGTRRMTANWDAGDYTITSDIFDADTAFYYGGVHALSMPGVRNVLVGEGTNNSLSTGYDCTFLGYRAGYDHTDQVSCTYVGSWAGYNATGGYNTAVGKNAGYRLEGGTRNTILGADAGYNLNDGVWNTIVGYQAGYGVNGSDYNYVCAFGYEAGEGLTTGSNHVLIGLQAGFRLTSGADCVNIGYRSGQLNVTGSNNITIGTNAGLGASTYSYSNTVLIGYEAGKLVTTGGNSVKIGHQAGFSGTTQAGCVMLGYQAGYSETGSNKLYIENSNSATPLIYGEFDNDEVGINVGAGCAATLHVDQPSTSGAKPVLYLDQADVDEEFIRFDGTSAADQTNSISTVNGDGAVTGPKDFSASAGWAFEGMVRININGTDRWMPYYSADTS